MTSPRAKSPPLPRPAGRGQAPKGPRLVIPFRDLAIDDIAVAGGKNASLGVDRDSELAAHLFDERDPEFAEWLAGLRIDSMSLNPDSLPAVARRLGAAGEQPGKENPSWKGQQA